MACCFLCCSNKPVTSNRDYGNSKEGKIVAMYGNPNTFQTTMAKACWAEPCYCCFAFACPCPASYCARKEVLDQKPGGFSANYRCCQGYFDCHPCITKCTKPWRSCPCLGLCCAGLTRGVHESHTGAIA
jgi:hypothetical protein